MNLIELSKVHFTFPEIKHTVQSFCTYQQTLSFARPLSNLTPIQRVGETSVIYSANSLRTPSLGLSNGIPKSLIHTIGESNFTVPEQVFLQELATSKTGQRCEFVPDPSIHCFCKLSHRFCIFPLQAERIFYNSNLVLQL